MPMALSPANFIFFELLFPLLGIGSPAHSSSSLISSCTRCLSTALFGLEIGKLAATNFNELRLSMSVPDAGILITYCVRIVRPGRNAQLLSFEGTFPETIVKRCVDLNKLSK